MTLIAIDLGLKGGFAYDDIGIVEAIPMPTVAGGKAIDWQEAMTWIGDVGPDRIYVERLAVFPKTKKNAAMVMGRQQGYIEGIALALEIPLVLVTPTQWQRGTLMPMRNGTTKQRSVLTAQKLYPDMDLTFGGRFKNPHDGMADALCILDWARRHERGLQ